MCIYKDLITPIFSCFLCFFIRLVQDRTRVKFIMADGCDLPRGMGQFGLIVLSLTLHHLPDPMAFLEEVSNLIAPSGVLVISESYTWHEMMDLPKVNDTCNHLNIIVAIY